MDRYINTRKSETKMMKMFEWKYGKPDRVLIIFGDYSKQQTMKGCEPHIAKLMKRLFKRYGYEVYLIDEYNTSKLCNKCGSENENYKHKGEDGHCHKVWGLLRCKSDKCLTFHNRDDNSALNMIKITKEIFKNGTRPEKYKNLYKLTAY